MAEFPFPSKEYAEKLVREHHAARDGECRCRVVGWTRDPAEPHIPPLAEWEQAEDCPVHPLLAAEKDARSRAPFWWRSLADNFEKVDREFIKRALAAEQAEKGHECGHRFEISIRSSLHVSGPGEHTDADWFEDSGPITVRAHNLRDALLIAATLPLSDWFPDEETSDLPPGNGGTDAGE